MIDNDQSNSIDNHGSIDVIGGDNPLWGKNQCFVEDFMLLKPDTDVVVLFPTTWNKVDNIIESFDDKGTRPSVFNFGQGSNVGKSSDLNYYYCMNGCIMTNPKGGEEYEMQSMFQDSLWQARRLPTQMGVMAIGCTANTTMTGAVS